MRDFNTFKSGQNVIHYTCQSVDDNTLKKNSIEKIGVQFGIGANEVLSFPEKLFKKKGFFTRTSEEMQINCEKILRNLSY